jgi:hypothetical protein
MEMKKDMLFLCIERIFGLISGCRYLEKICADCRSNTMTLMCSIEKVGEHLREKRGLTLCYNCRRSRHFPKEFSRTGPICLCCKIVGHEVEDFPMMIAKVERMNIRQENYEESQETKSMLEIHKEKGLEEVHTTLVHLK